MYPLTAKERAAERAEAQAEDAAERLQIIKDARNNALQACRVALLYLRSEAEEARAKGAPKITDLEVRETLAVVDEALCEMVFRIVDDLEDMECCQGRHELAALADEAAEARADAQRDEFGLRGAP